MAGLNTYQNKEGYKICATEKAYKMFYEKQGFKKVTEEKKSEPATEAAVDKQEEFAEEKSLEKWSLAELKAALTDAGMEYDDKATKKELVALLQQET